jgi:hypothetical protein
VEHLPLTERLDLDWNEDLSSVINTTIAVTANQLNVASPDARPDIQ